jgi:hypothetical protein
LGIPIRAAISSQPLMVFVWQSHLRSVYQKQAGAMQGYASRAFCWQG